MSDTYEFGQFRLDTMKRLLLRERLEPVGGAAPLDSTFYAGTVEFYRAATAQQVAAQRGN